MRRAISLLTGLSLLALGLGLAFTPASAHEEGTCSGQVVVQLDAWVWAREGHDSLYYSLPQPLDAGQWAVNTYSFDSYPGREDSSQDHEQWILDLVHDGAVVATLGPTGDIPDGVEYGDSVDHLGLVTLDDGADSLRVRHVGDSTEDGTDSVHAACVGFEPVAPPTSTTTPMPGGSSTTTTSAPPTTSVPGGSSTTTTVPGGSSTTSTVPGGSSTTTTAPGGSSTTTTVPGGSSTSTVPGGTTQGPGGDGASAPGAIGRLGAIPRMSASLDCSARSIIVDVTNIGDTSAMVDVFLVSNSVRTDIAVAPGSDAEIDFPLPASAENRTFDLLVSDRSGVVDTGSVHVDCKQSSSVTATTSIDCSTGLLVVDLSNRGQEADSVSVIVERSGLVETVALSGGGSEQVSVNIGDRPSIPLRVVGGDGSDILRRTVGVGCPTPRLGVSKSVSCATNEVLVTVWNRGDAEGLVGARLGDGPGLEGIVVEPGNSVVMGLPYEPASGPKTLVLIGSDSLEAASGEMLIGCQTGAPQSPAPCSSVSIVDSSASTTTIIPTPNPGESWWVEAGPIPGSATPEGLNPLRSCATPEVEFSPNCSIGTLTIRMSNAGSIATRLVVLVDGEATSGGIDLAPGADTITATGISGAKTVEVVEAGRVESLATLHLSCGSGGQGLRNAAYAVLSLSILTSLLSAVIDPKRLIAIFK